MNCACVHCAGKVAVIKYIFEEATLHSNSNLFGKIACKQSSLSVLFDALVLCDTFGGNTPLHLCAEMLAKCSHIAPNNEQLCCVNALLDFIEERQQRAMQCKSRGRVQIIDCFSS